MCNPNFHTILNKELQVFRTDLSKVKIVLQSYIMRFLYIVLIAVAIHL